MSLPRRGAAPRGPHLGGDRTSGKRRSRRFATPGPSCPLYPHDAIIYRVMNASSEIPAPSFFCRHAEVSATRANLPHWEQCGATCYATFRLADSLPNEKLAVLREERSAWLALHPEPWDDATTAEYRNEFDGRVQKWLDAGYGSCIMKDTSCRQIVESVLRRFDRIRYILYAFVVMPNHVHILFTPLPGQTASSLLRQWKGVSAHELNTLRKTRGTVWQKESWDTLVRNQFHFQNILTYIHANDPAKAWSAYR